MMAPILEDLRAQYTEDFEAIFVDVWVDREAAARYGVRVIPTQIFFDEGGNELRRHVGFFSREEILGTWEEPGYSFPAR
jgi:thioredoxin 1